VNIDARTARLALKLVIAIPALIYISMRGAHAGRAMWSPSGAHKHLIEQVAGSISEGQCRSNRQRVSGVTRQGYD
jgi:hypothetical protein